MNVDTMLIVWLSPLGFEPNAEGRLVVLIFEWPCCRWFVFCQIGSRPVGFFVLTEGPVLQTGEGIWGDVCYSWIAGTGRELSGIHDRA
ncbi:hypothetical protein F2Q70_00017801 [Brassica cretica]|uniref:Uncharacterized protein n=1 Tax=Brassica cretica TaxID=69181 RepID=A0A3N6Q4H5_BRACR|nr:hypothetical protein F2Q70_00017801 [Brassica cretica]KAF2600535.1 hypothetical protein F2Q68_00010744 [Brassica cretica]